MSLAMDLPGLYAKGAEGEGVEGGGSEGRRGKQDRFGHVEPRSR